MINKFVCLTDGCLYVTQKKNEALNHTLLDEHIVIEISPDLEEIKCAIFEPEYLENKSSW